MTNKEQILLKELQQAIVEMQCNKAEKFAKKIVKEEIDLNEATKSLSKGMEIVSEKYGKEEYFIPEVLMCAKAMDAALSILREHSKEDTSQKSVDGVIGVVEGDVHDLGKNVVKIMLESAGFKMYDLGYNVPLRKFISKAQELKVKMICMSALMSTTMEGMRKVIHYLIEENLRDKYRIFVGGAPVSISFAQEIGAEGYAENASSAVRMARKLLGEDSAYAK